MTPDSRASTSGRPALGRIPALELFAVLGVSIAFALSFGWNFGTGNQATYFVPSLRLLDHELLQRDWHETATTALHPTFRHFGALLLALDRDGWGVALGFTAIVAAGTATLYFAVRACAGAQRALPGFFLLLALLFRTRTSGPATTYVFDGALQPSTLSSALFLAAVPYFASGRFVASGLLLAASGLCHVNLLVLLLPAFALAHLLLGRQDLARRLVQQLGPALLVFLGFLPMLLAAAAPNEGRELAQRVYQELRFPHHFLIRNLLAEFAPLFVWQLVAAGAVLPLVGNGERRALARVLALAGSLAAVVWLGVGATLVQPRAAQLFSWRIAAHAELLLQLVSLGAFVLVLTDRELLRRYRRGTLVLVSVGFALTLLVYARVRHHAVVELLLIFGAGLAFSALRARTSARDARATFGSERAGRLLLAGSALVLVLFGLAPVRRFPIHSSLLRAAPDAEQRLYAWMRTGTRKDAAFLTPPELENVRLLGERAIVVDWKSPPGLANELVEWYQRLKAVTGMPDLRSMADLAGYDRLDDARLASLRAHYGFDYAVVRRGRETRLAPRPHAYENEGFVVLELGK